jgi:hypothetical protein
MSTTDSPPPAGAQTLTAREAAGSSTRPLPVVHPGTGELLEDLGTVGPERLADLLLAVRDKQAALKEIERVVSDEIRGRMQLRGRRVWVVGNYGLELDTGRESVWDADELEAVLRRLVDDGAVNAGEVTEVIRHQTVVSRTEAKRLASRLHGAAQAAVQQCCTWRDKTGTPRVRVQRQAQLVQESPE